MRESTAKVNDPGHLYSCPQLYEQEVLDSKADIKPPLQESGQWGHTWPFRFNGPKQQVNLC
jgi:hypothetical protein